MNVVRRLIRAGFDRLEGGLGFVFPAAWNPLLNLGAIGFFCYWIITVSGIYVYIFFDTGITAAFASVEYMTHEQWYAAGVMRSLHRYASDLLVVAMLVHLLREFGLDHYRGVRYFSWVTGVFVLVLVYVAGITGYWLVWDMLGQYVAIVSTEWLDRLGIFGEPIARNFLSPERLDNRFFTLLIFMHIAVPLIALMLLWLHLQRVTKPRINPPRGLMLGVLGALMMLSLVYPAESQGSADLAKVPGTVGLDWFYLGLYPLLETWPGPLTWGGGAALLVIMLAMPWLPPMRRAAAAVVDLANCNGCTRCAADCPYTAISMVPRSDGRVFEREAAVDPSLCVACGICAGSCPTATPFRRASALVPGIDLPDRTIASIREQTERAAASLQGDRRIIVFGCDHGVPLDVVVANEVGTVRLACVGQLPPSFVDYVLSRDLADGVVLAGCADNACHARHGISWTEARLAGTRDPHLRSRVPRERLRTLWAGRRGRRALDELLQAFAQELGRLPAVRRSPKPARALVSEEPRG